MVLDHYLNTGDGLTMPQLGRLMGKNVQYLRKVLTGDHRLQVLNVADHKGFVQEYIPTRPYLRCVILALIERQKQAVRMGAN